MKIFYVLMTVVFFVGCSSVAKKAIKEAAGKDFDCLSVRVKVKEIDGNKYQAKGCGKTSQYKVSNCKSIKNCKVMQTK